MIICSRPLNHVKHRSLYLFDGCKSITLRFFTDTQKRQYGTLTKPKRTNEATLVSIYPKTPFEIYLHNEIKSKNFKKIWETAVDQAERKSEYDTFETYALLLKALNLGKKKEKASLALSLFQKAMTMHKLSGVKFKTLSFLLLLNFRDSDDFTDLLALKIFWNDYLSTSKADRQLNLTYHSTFLHVLLNTHQNQVLLEYFAGVVNKFGDRVEDVVETLPISRLFDVLTSNKDCDTLVLWLTKFPDSTLESVILSSDWDKYLSLALSLNHYDLVKLVYDRKFTKGVKVTTEDAIFKDQRQDLSNFNDKSDDEISQILHTLASHGDVNLTLSLIESNYIHRNLRGEKGLTKDLKAKVIEAYCHHKRDVLEDDTDDDSIKIILDVLNEFLLRDNGKSALGYRDIGQFMSFKFLNYSGYGSSSDEENQKNHQKIGQNDTSVTLKAMGNSSHGNILADLNVLNKFLTSHLTYMANKKNFSVDTIRLFINCVLNHINLYQNFSGMVRALVILRNLNPKFLIQWIDDDLIDIVLNSISNSRGARLSSLQVFQFLQNKGKLNHDRYLSIIKAVSKENESFFEFYMYHYYHTYYGYMSIQINKLLKEYLSTESKRDSNVLLQLYQMVRKLSAALTPEQIDQFWRDNGLCNDEKRLKMKDKPNYGKKFIKSFDERDSEYLRYVLENKS